jgi:hypothetical protein
MTRRFVVATIALVALAAALTVIVATQGGASKRTSLARLSNDGRNVTLQRGVILREAHLQHASLLAVRGRLAVYRLEGRNSTCFGTGDSSDVGQVGSVQCAHGPFPTAGRPVLDLSIYEGTTRGVRELSLYRAEGVAADGVTAVEFLRPDGSVALKVPVLGNVYSTTDVPGGPIAGVAAVDKAGQVLWRSP